MTIPINGSKHCQHTHLSGRACGRRIHTAVPFCPRHRDYNSDGSTKCQECSDMLAVFPIRKHLEGGDTDGIV